MNEDQQRAQEIVASMEVTMGLQVGRLWRLYGEDDDWSLVVRSAALIETALNQCLLRTVRPTPAADWLSRRPMRDKIILAKDLNLISGEVAQRIKAVSRIRNAAVHDIRAFNFSLLGYLQSDADFRNEIAKPLTRTPDGGPGDVNAVMSDPRWAIWSAAADVVMAASVLPDAEPWRPTWANQGPPGGSD